MLFSVVAVVLWTYPDEQSPVLIQTFFSRFPIKGFPSIVQGIIPLHIESILVFTSAGYIFEMNWRFPSTAPGRTVLKPLFTSKLLVRSFQGHSSSKSQHVPSRSPPEMNDPSLVIWQYK